jgi:G6PDH family F420-dependent oxidoreductase
MAEFGYFLSSEEHSGRTLVAQAQAAEAAGMTKVAISDHFHPWMDAQGHSPFVWSVIGGIAATTGLEVTTAVTCPIMRIHPAILAQATATSAEMLGGRFRFGIGTGERLNEHVLGQHWPPAAVRQEMLREAVEVVRQLWTGELVTHHGEHFTVENARIYTTAPSEIPVLMSAFGPGAAELAADIADGLIHTKPAADIVEQYRSGGGTGPAVATTKACWAPTEEEATKLVHELWRSSGVPGEAMQELANPAHFEAAADLVTPEKMAEAIPCGPDPEVHLTALRELLEAGFDEVLISQVGEDQAGYLEFFQKELRPKLG